MEEEGGGKKQHPQLSPQSFPSWWKLKMRAFQRPPAPACASAPLGKPRLFLRVSVCVRCTVEGAFYQREASWLPSAGCLNKDPHELLSLKSM